MVGWHDASRVRARGVLGTSGRLGAPSAPEPRALLRRARAPRHLAGRRRPATVARGRGIIGNRHALRHRPRLAVGRPDAPRLRHRRACVPRVRRAAPPCRHARRIGGHGTNPLAPPPPDRGAGASPRRAPLPRQTTGSTEPPDVRTDRGFAPAGGSVCTRARHALGRPVLRAGPVCERVPTCAVRRKAARPDLRVSWRWAAPRCRRQRLPRAHSY